MRRRYVLLVLSLCPIAVISAAWFARVLPFLDSQSAFDRYLRFDARRDQQITDPLVLCGDAVVPRVIAGLKNRTMEGRPWAAAFLGSGGYMEAAPVLADLAQDQHEHTHTRRYALQALALLQPSQAEAIASTMTADPELARTAEQVLRRDYSETYRRSYLEALLNLGD